MEKVSPPIFLVRDRGAGAAIHAAGCSRRVRKAPGTVVAWAEHPCAPGRDPGPEQGATSPPRQPCFGPPPWVPPPRVTAALRVTFAARGWGRPGQEHITAVPHGAAGHRRYLPGFGRVPPRRSRLNQSRRRQPYHGGKDGRRRRRGGGRLPR